MSEFVTQHALATVTLILLVLALSACAAHYSIHPGALSRADSAAYDALLIAKTAIDQAGSENVRPEPLDALIRAYNVAREAWQLYHGALATKTPSLEYFDRLNSNLADLMQAIRTFKEAP